MEKFEIDDRIVCIFNTPLHGNFIAPPLEVGKDYRIKAIVLDSEGWQHLDVGLSSECEIIHSYETGEILPASNFIHWCHPTRFYKIK